MSKPVTVEISFKTLDYIEKLYAITMEEFEKELDAENFQKVKDGFDYDKLIQSAVSTILIDANKHFEGECGF